MKKKNTNIICLIAIIIAFVTCVGIRVAKIIQHNKEIDEACAAIKNWNYTHSLYIKGEFSYEGNKIYVQDMTKYDENQLMVDVAFYNCDHENEQITVEQLYEDYEAFLNGEEANILVEFADYDNGDIGNEYYLYNSSINQELKNIREEKKAKGENVSTKVYIRSASPEEVREAIHRVHVRDKNDIYTRRLYIKGEFSYEGSYEEYKLSVENPEYNDKLLMVDVEYVNACNVYKQYTMEQLYEEYEAFLNGDGEESYKNLDEYIKDFDYPGNVYADYCYSIYDELELIRDEKEKKGEEVIIDNVYMETTQNNWKNVSSVRIEIVGGSFEEIREAIKRIPVRHAVYASWLYIKGDFSYENSYEKNKVSVKNPEYNDKLLMVDVGFVNYCNKNEPFSTEQLYEEYEAFLNGESKEKYKNLEKYIEIIGYYHNGRNYEDYCHLVYDELKLIRDEKEKKGEKVVIDYAGEEAAWNDWSSMSTTRQSIVGASPDEISEAINRVHKKGMSAILMLKLSVEAVSKSWE